MLLAACSQPGPSGDVEEHRDQHRPREAQSDFLDIGKQAGIEWLSFVQQDQDKYPEYFDGLDRDQKRRLRLANTGDGEMVLLEFNLPEGSKLWPVDWYGTELMAIERPADRASDTTIKISIALAKDNNQTLEQIGQALADKRAKQLEGSLGLATTTSTLTTWRDGTREGEAPYSGVVGLPTIVFAARSTKTITEDFEAHYSYSARRLKGESTTVLAILEYEAIPNDVGSGTVGAFGGAEILRDLAIKREIALEGGPKHKVSSSLELLLGGTLHYPKGSLVLPIGDELVRKTGNDSTVQIDAHGAKPWLLLRHLKESDLPGDLRARVRADTTFNRRLKESGAQFSAGYDPGWNFPAVLWDYSHAGGEQIVLGVLVVGDELLSLEVVSTGLRDGEARRRAKTAALELLKGANTAPVGDRKPLEPLVGWNLGNMGRD